MNRKQSVGLHLWLLWPLVLCLIAWTRVGQAQTTLPFATFYTFSSSDGAYPSAALMQATNGNLYGTTYGGGINGTGTVFKITTDGALTTLYNFGRTGSDGDDSLASLIQANDGNLYGTTNSGGNRGYGTIFRIGNILESLSPASVQANKVTLP